MSEKYYAVPVWNGAEGRWEAVDFRRGQRVVGWPKGFAADSLPIPEYNPGDHVQFIRDETCAREGVVRLVLLQVHGGQGEQGEALQRGYLAPDNITYIVTARGHDHRIKAWNILGRYVSHERVSRLLPLHE